MAVPKRPMIALTLVTCLLSINGGSEAVEYLGKFLGKLSELHHGVSGEVYAVDSRTLHIKDFTYDGQGPAAYFFAGNSRAPGNTGFRIRDENGSPEVLRRYRKEGVTITLPEGKSLNNIKWFSVWCEEFEVNFGDVKIPKNFEYPRPQKIDGLRGVHAVSSDNIVIVDAQTLLVPNLSYDGEAPDAKFWVGRGSKPSPQGIRVPDENGKEIPLRRYDRKTVVLTLPGDLTVFDIGHFGIWCEAFTVDFGHVQIPQQVNVPPSLKMLGVSPQSKLNCEVLHDDLAFEVRWAVAGDSIVLQLVAKLENGEYMSFGISGDENHSQMIGGDVVVAWVDKETLKGYAEDYYLEAKSQCSGPRGSCPDSRLADNTNNIRLLNAAMVNGYSIVTYQRPLRATDEFDKPIVTNRSQPIIWAIGPLNQRNEVSFHSIFNKRDKVIDFGRSAKWNCPMPEGDQPPMKPVTVKPVIQEEYEPEEKIVEEPEPEPPKPTRTRNNERRRGGSSNRQEVRDSEKSATRTRNTERRGSRPVPTPAPVKNRNAWDIPPIQCHEPDDGVFYAQMGPTGGKRGYPAITGHVGWGISWYINGLLIPEINVVRGKTYTFVVEGGFDPEIPAKYHPFYITDDSIGGYEHKTSEEKQNVRIFAGARQAKDGSVHPTGVGRLCHWTHQGDSDADDFESFGAYQRTLELKCDQGEPGVIQWTPDKDTPDTVYYQCFTHRYLGWKINVLDACDHESAGSEVVEVIADLEEPAEDLSDSPSLRVETRVKPNNIEDVLNKEDKTTEKVNLEKEEDDVTFQPKNSFSYMDLETTEKSQIPYSQELPKYEIDKVFKTQEEIDNEELLLPVKNVTLIPFPPKSPMGMGKIILRRPVPVNIRPPFIAKPHIRPPGMHRMPPMSYKKPYYRPLIKMQMPSRPVVLHHPMKYEKPAMLQSMATRPHNIVIMKPHIFNKPSLVLMPAESTILQGEPQVDISPQQSSTEKELGVQTEKAIIEPLSVEKQYETYESMKPAVNTGFNPASVIIESGFKPIITKEIEHRMSEAEEEGPELKFESEVGMIDETKESKPLNEQKATEFFEPMFIPSPTIELKKSQIKKKSPVFSVKQPRIIREDVMAAANERIESYYLPPDNNKAKPVERPRQRSNIDVPPGTVVTYDGKKVSGASLTVRAGNERASIGRSSKASEFIRARPQFVPFKGELPPLDVQYVSPNAPQLQARVLNRELDTPNIPSSTKLKLIRQLEDIPKTRRKRAAHHTEEHTAQQKEEEVKKSAASSVQITFYTLLASFVLQYLIKL